jgi:hypothetical protein
MERWRAGPIHVGRVMAPRALSLIHRGAIDRLECRLELTGCQQIRNNGLDSAATHFINEY